MQPIYLAAFTLREYFLASWFYAEFLLFSVILFLYRDHYWLLDREEVYLILSTFGAISAALTTLRIVKRETSARIYIIMTKGLSRNVFLMGQAIAITLLDGLFLSGLFILGFKFTLIGSNLTFFEALFRLIPVFFVLMITEMIMLCLSPLVMKKTTFLVGISLIILGYYQPEFIPRYFLPPIQQLIKSSYTSPGLKDLIVGGFNIALFYYLANFFFNKRDLDYRYD